MLSDVSWFGIDYAFTMMNPLTLHHSKVIPEMYKLLGREEEAAHALVRWYGLRDSMGSPNDPPHQKVRLMKEYNREKLNTEVFGGDPKAIKLYGEYEIRERRPTDGLREALLYLKGRGKTMAIVTEVSSVSGVQGVAAFLKVHGLTGLFSEIISPAGRLTESGELVDSTTFSGSNKKEGTIYQRLASYLDAKGIGSQARAMVGDDPKNDIEASKKYGFFTILYGGVLDRGQSDLADMVIRSWKELPAAMQ